MWELSKLTSRGGLSVRRIFIYALTAFIAAFLWIILTSPATHAADAEWNGGTIQYEGNTYYGPAATKTVKALGLEEKTQVFTYVEPSSTTGTATVQRKIHVIYFAPGVDSSVATGAKYKTYIYQGPDSYSEPSFPKEVSLTAKTAASATGTSSCAVDGGLGWIICPLTNTLASAMDWIFDVLTGFLAVRPVETTNTNGLFRAWTYMRTFANVAFVIAFIIIIYSQLTNFGINNYGIKKLLPRLIIAALLVNVSYYICALAVDISNVLAFSIQDVFIAMRNSIVGAEGNSWDVMSWQSISGLVLSGGTAAAAGGVGIAGVVTTVSLYGIGGSIFLLLPTLLTALLAVLVALAIMATRQAIITILVILAPLAFVAYLLPNTEKWFDKWRELFMTMLILFPAFSVIFGGSQLAASAIIQNADSFNLIILGMLVQVAPLFITPLLIRFSGSLLGRIAGIINNPNKGIIDRTRKFSQDRADNIKARRLGEPATPRQFLRRHGQKVDHDRRRREGWRNAHNSMADARWSNTRDFSDIDQSTRYSGEVKRRGEEGSALRYDISRSTAGTAAHGVDQQLRHIKTQSDSAKLVSDNMWEQNHNPIVVQEKLRLRQLTDRHTELKAEEDKAYEIMKTKAYKKTTEYASLSPEMKTIVTKARKSAGKIALYNSAAQSAKNIQQQDVLQTLSSSLQAREIAGASIIDPHGASKAESAALAAIGKIEAENVTNAVSLLGRDASKQPTPMTALAYAKKIITDIEAGNIANYDSTMIEAAYETQAQDSGGIFLEQGRQNPAVDQSMLTRVIARNADKLKTKGYFHLFSNPGLAGATDDEMNAGRAKTLGGTSASNINGIKAGGFEYMADHIDEIIAAGDQEDLEKAYTNIRGALISDDIYNGLDQKKEAYIIEAALAKRFMKTPTPKRADDIV